jgi:hypothetical protein
MIVTADATGDFNATSQILRYSALAREITVPRIPSVTSTILCTAARPGSSGSSTGSGASTPHSAEMAAELIKLADEVAVLALELEEERSRREAAERSWAACEARVEALEEQVRQECWDEMEDLLERERIRWRAAWEGEAERGEERVDAKIDILARGAIEDDGVEGSTEDERKEKEMEELREENRRLIARLDLLEREKLCKTPSAGKKQRMLKSKKWEAVELESD